MDGDIRPDGAGLAAGLVAGQRGSTPALRCAKWSRVSFTTVPESATMATRLIVAISPMDASAALKTVATACSAPQTTRSRTSTRSTASPVGLRAPRKTIAISEYE